MHMMGFSYVIYNIRKISHWLLLPYYKHLREVRGKLRGPIHRPKNKRKKTPFFPPFESIYLAISFFF